MGRLIIRTGKVLLISGIVVLVSAGVVGVKYGIEDRFTTWLLFVSLTLISLSLCLLYSQIKKEKKPVGSTKGYYITALLEEPGVKAIPFSSKVHISENSRVETSDGVKIGVDANSYLINEGKLQECKQLPRNGIAFPIEFFSQHDERYFRLLLEKKFLCLSQERKSVAGIRRRAMNKMLKILPHEGHISISMVEDFRGSVVEYILYSMAMSQELISGIGMEFFKWYPVCCLGMTKSTTPYKQALMDVDSTSIFDAFPGAWWAAYNYKEVFQHVIDYSKDIALSRNKEPDNTYFSNSEIVFLESLQRGAEGYSKFDKRECVYAEKALMHMLSVMYVMLSRDTHNVFDRTSIKSWLNGIMLHDFGSKEVAIHVAMTSLGGEMFQGKLLSSIYGDLCSEVKTFGIMRKHMDALLRFSANDVTHSMILDFVDEKGMEFFAMCGIMVPYFHKTRVYRLLKKNAHYRMLVSDISYRIKNFDVFGCTRPNERTILSMISYHGEEKQVYWEGNKEEEEKYIRSSRNRIYRMLREFEILETTCCATAWPDPSVLMFFVKLAVWMWAAKELSILRGVEPLELEACSVHSVLGLYVKSYWRNLGVDVLMRGNEYSVPIDAMLLDEVSLNFRVAPCEDTLVKVSRGSLSDAVYELVHGREKREIRGEVNAGVVLD
ncbi:hypothetical protein P029_01845 [Anaplasma phagocytophilum str. Norway variant2]|uniref:Uncharacterized protein n=1 Tax=Anaplasma phagocytophilum str. Norway variant2 TaxID=1392507 RepID=A0A161IG55_ANAPH|nr:hypothetical protein [Anaplasma phagocytophilum]ANC34139.1 hypothetical protein P029_01845 [Anaplasma phagocytophilum str. Norway variant2]